MKISRLGNILLKQKRITAEDLEKAVNDMKINRESLLTQLVKKKLFTEEELTKFISKASGCRIVDLDQIEIDPGLGDISMEIMRKHMALPIKRAGNLMTLAVTDPFDITAQDELRFITNCKIDMVIVPESQILAKFDEVSGADEHLGKLMEDFDTDNVDVVDTSEADINIDQVTGEAKQDQIVNLVNYIMLDAIKRDASDIHLEPYEKVGRVRYRIDGVLHEMFPLPLSKRDNVVARIKILARLDISERRLPQGGRIKLRVTQGKVVDFRVSVLPTLFGEKVVMRLLDPGSLQLDMTKLGYEEASLKWLKDVIHRPYGMVLVTGPTGSGKTVSLYSAVAELNEPSVNISTAEDPVEFNFMGINQVNINQDIGLDFPSVLREFLRQDPDIILIGEIRDFDTAAIGIKAALTGHMVLATLHTNDAPSTLTRLVDMGIERFLVGSAVNLVSAQRLARRNCKECSEPVNVPPESLIDAGVPEGEVSQYKPMQGKGCSACNGTGYKGRVGIYQVMPVFNEIREAMYSGANADEINALAVKRGVKTLRMAALGKVKEGVISLKECLRVTVTD